MPKVASGHLEARRQSIVDAAARVFSSRGIQTATMAEVAAEAGISPGAIYRYFPSKEDLARCCFNETGALLKEMWTNVPPDAGNPGKEMRELSRLTFSSIGKPDQREGTVLFLEQLLAAIRDRDSEALDTMRAERREITAGLRGRIEAAQAAGQFGDYLDPARLSEALIALYWGSQMLNLVEPSAPVVENADQIMELLDRSGTGTP